MGGTFAKDALAKVFPPGGGFFGASPPGVKLIAVSYANIVAPNTGATFFTIATPAFFTIPAGKAWRFHTSGLVSPAAGAGHWNVEWQVGGVALGGELYPLYNPIAWQQGNYGSSFWELDMIISNPNSGGVWNYDYRLFNNSRGVAPAVSDVSDLSSIGNLVPTLALGIKLVAATTIAGATVTHVQTFVEQLQ